ncbi:PREDICTED: zinc finger protein 14-like [Cyphomyrmex costatus]|uniref:zinc finger protein 14-like n=1 Tax=Cyphomyrmex costatus TaxID=456900 RepID=UPI0008524014|nr:PREDICTED: zinc finger protein 14-like [Cyphomyrmex costatus]
MHYNNEHFKSNKDLYTRGVLHKCGTCNKEFKNKTHFRNHERTHTGEKPYQCEFCKYKCGQKVHLRRHMVSKHKDDERFKSNKDLYAGGVLHKCGTCNKEFKYKTDLRSHERTHTGEKPYQCEFCKYKCRINGNLRQHVVAMHNSDERFKSNKDLYIGGISHKCGTCNKEFKYKTQFRRHERTHTGEKPYQCEFCKYKCGQKVHLRIHMISKHKDDERFKSNKDLYAGGVLHKCGTCNKEFKYKTDLRSHERTHTGEKPYQCEFCKYKCRINGNLRQHVVAMHNSDERFKSNKDLYIGGISHKCGTCNKEFKYKTQFRRHERTHTGEKPYQCEFCKYKCGQKVHLHIHMISKHKDDERFKSNKDLYAGGVLYKCETCNKEFKNKTHFRSHERTHTGEKPYQCEFCKYKCRQKVQLSSHVISKHKGDERFKFNKDLYSGGVSHKCGTCNKGFINKAHLHIHERTHIGNKPYHWFKTNWSLRRHERTHENEKPYQCDIRGPMSRQKVHLRIHMISKHKDDERFKSNKDLYAGGVLHKCGTCNKEFKNKSHLRSHERTHTGEKPYQCEFCEYKCRQKTQLRSHVISKHKDHERFKSNKNLYIGGVSHKCGTCNKEFIYKTHLHRHEITHTEKKPYQCDFCKDKFARKAQLSCHMISKHKDDERFKFNKDLYAGGVLRKCGTCNKEFKNKTHLRNHERTHTGEKPYVCEFCKHKCRTKSNLRQHVVAMHNSDERFKSNKDLYIGGIAYKCGTCNKEFMYKTQFRRHERTHAGEKPYQCEFCEKKFRLKIQLSNHMISIHNDDERFKSNKDLYAGGVLYKCGTCNKEFKNKTHLRNHERTHTGEKPYVCEFCKYKCRQKVHLRTHMISKHKDDERFKSNKDLYAGGVLHKCGTCNKEFKNKTNLRSHERTHTGEKPYQCEFCKYKYGTKNNLSQHVVAMHNSDERFKSNKNLYIGGVSYKCGTCNKEFKGKAQLNRHERTHTGEKPYQCEFCENKYT